MSDNENKTLEQRVRSAMAESQQHGFSAGFEERALARWRAERAVDSEPTMFALIEHRARRVLPFAIAASLLLAVYSAKSARGTSTTTSINVIERALGWKEVAAVDLFESVYGLPASTPGAR